MIKTTHLFLPLDKKLIELLRSLSPEEWNKPTLAKLWTVKDIAAHLLDGNIRTLSLARDQQQLTPDREINSYTDLVAYLNKLNADWVTATKRMSPQVLTDLLEITGQQYAAYFQTLDMNADAIFSVAWAGEHTSRNWFHIAREFTEKWHHQQQIREATGKPGIMIREFFYPVMDTFMRGLAHTYRNTNAPVNTAIQLTVDTEIGGYWYLLRTDNGWQLADTVPMNITASLVLPPDLAWKLFTKAITPERALEKVTISGDEQLAEVALSMIAVMA